MRLILVGGIPSWRDGDLTLPVMAGGQEDPFDDIFGSSAGDDITPYAGQLWNTDGTQLIGTLTPSTEAGGPAQLKIAASGSVIPFSGGTFQTATGHVVTLSPAGEIQIQAQAGDAPITGVTVRDIGGGLIGEFDQNGNLINTRVAPTGPSGPTAPAFSGTQAGIQFQNNLAVAEAKRQEALAAGNLVEAQRWEEQQRLLQAQWEEQSQQRGFEFSAEQNALTEEAALKRQRLSTLSDLIRTFVGAQSQARDTLANLQPDQFRFAAVAGGIAPFGATPQQGFQQQLQQFAGAQVPQFDPSGSAASLEPVIAQLTGAQAPQQPQAFGFAEGGTIEMTKGADGTFSATPSPAATARLVGEGRHGEGLAAGTAEVMIVTPQGTTVLPLSRGFQAGGAIGFPFQPIQFNRESLLPALTTSGIFQPGTIPRGNIQPDQSIAGFSGGLGFPSNFFQNTGIRPQFFSKFGEDEVFFRDPNTPGQFRLVTDTAGQGATGQIQPRSVVQVADFDQFGTLGSTAIGAQELGAQLAEVGGRPSPFTKFSAPLIEPTTGTLLPAPFTVAAEMNQLRVTNPGAFNLLLNAYELAGAPAQQVLSTIQSSLAFGSGRGNIGLN